MSKVHTRRAPIPLSERPECGMDVSMTPQPGLIGEPLSPIWRRLMEDYEKIFKHPWPGREKL